ncbi:hypothetical protein MMC17_004177 [Xylographa soralifera]|nr:hypothetical protein [Xylographa soralifera]
MAEARASCRELHDLVQQTLAGNQDIASRLKTLEVRHKARSTWEVGTQTSMDETLDDKSTIRPWNAADDRAITTIPFVPATPYTFTFEQDLQASRVYCRATRRNSALSHTSSIKDTVGWSVLSDLSLAQVSNISVFALPIAAAELYNYQDYEIRTREAGATSVSHHIEQAENKSVRVLILGNTKSGKSTIFKQFLLMSSEDSSWTRAYVKEAIRHVLEDSIHDMLACLNKIREDAIYPNYKYAWAILSGNNQSFKDKIRAVKVFWEDSSVKEVMYQQGYRKNDNLDYYLNELERLIDVNYVPSAQDALYLWIETTGICSQRMEIDQVTYNISDVGGHHTERKKWIHAFKNVDCIIFTVALSDYNTVTHGNATALHESLTLFESIVNSKWFTKSPCFLVFTKRDLFNKKLEFDPLWNYFPSYEGGDNNENAYRYLTEPFEKLKQKREIPFHILSASSVTSAGTIVRSIHEYLLRINKCIPSLSDEEYRSDRKRQTQRSWIAAAKELSFWADENHSVMADYNLWLKRSDVIRSEHIEVTKTMKVEFM